MNKHTPGPWAEQEPGVIYSGNAIVARTAVSPVDAKDGEEPANARLIAAAPDLLAALEDAEFLLRKLSINPKEIGAMLDSLKRSAADARAAIAKARGE